MSLEGAPSATLRPTAWPRPRRLIATPKPKRLITLATVALAILAGPTLADSGPVGEWLTEKGDARVRVAACPDRADRLCGTVTWAERPPDALAGPLVDVNNADPALRSRPIEGLPLLDGFAAEGPGAWGDGTIYDPRSGRTYRSKLRQRAADRLEVSGCVLFVCLGETWRRYRP